MGIKPVISNKYAITLDIKIGISAPEYDIALDIKKTLFSQTHLYSFSGYTNVYIL